MGIRSLRPEISDHMSHACAFQVDKAGLYSLRIPARVFAETGLATVACAPALAVTAFASAIIEF
jgi:hypothetical protein